MSGWHIQGISRKRIHRLCTEIARVPSISSNMYKELRFVLERFMEQILMAAVIWTEHCHRMTVAVQDIERALRDIPPQSLPRGYATLCPDALALSSPWHWDGMRTTVCKEWRDKDSGDLIIDLQCVEQVFARCVDAPAPPMFGGPSFRAVQFKRVVCEVAQDYKTDLRWEAGSVSVFQAASEAYLVGLVSEGYAYTLDAGRAVLDTCDIQKVRATRAAWIPPAEHLLGLPAPSCSHLRTTTPLETRSDD